ncbi:outer membrane beta-barrel protein [Ekhidna sp.]|uniref:outer membrane beta-barrel protein n=2 Tax=Ekhidna sp. TaxID=2608089 RepID=UPI003C79AB18
MTRKDSSYASRFKGFLILVLLSTLVMAQKKPDKNPLESFLDTQFWLGIKMGMNYTQAFPETRNTGFSPIDYNADSLQKSYDNFALPGAHVGLEMNFYHKGFSASFQPAYKRSRFKYNSVLEWQGETSGNRFETRYDVEQRVDVLELPLMIKYDVIRSGKIRPFVMVGGFHSRILSAQKEVDITQIDYSSGNPLTSDGGSTSLGVKDAFKPFSGVSGGVGVNLDYWNIRTVFEVNYKHSLTSTTQPNVQQNELSSLGETNDEIFLRDINVSLSFVFPFRFIDQQFKAY